MRTPSGWVVSAAAAAVAGALLAGCEFAVVPPKAHAKPARPANPAAVRLADAPPLLVQCAIDRAGLRPGRHDWLSGDSVRIGPSNAADFGTWWRGHFTPGPYPQTFVIDGHRTHYLAFGATWVKRGGAWVPTHAARSDPRAERTSLYAYAVWTAAHDRLPPAVCGSTTGIKQLQARVFGSSVTDPW
ncbi:MAG TPA: hypothetical protein VH641_19670 [Streptosporangiaceae bacterium]|jgi:hypothetical protein